MISLRFCMQSAFDAGAVAHPQAVMAELGISYREGIPQSIASQWWFIGCTNVPEPLPSFLSALPGKAEVKP